MDVILPFIVFLLFFHFLIHPSQLMFEGVIIGTKQCLHVIVQAFDSDYGLILNLSSCTGGLFVATTVPAFIELLFEEE